MQSSLPLCREFFEKITAYLDYHDFRLTITANQPSITLPYYVDQKAHSIELVIFKTTFLSLFQEAHTYFNKTFSDQSGISNENIYYMTVGFLLTTPENKTVYNVHEDLLKGYFQDNSVLVIPDLLVKEVRLIQRLLCSSNNRINKSSSLWILYRKLFVLSLDANTLVLPDILFVFHSSGSQHFSNYYCWNTARWFYDNLPYNKRIELFNLTKRFCFQNVKDCSSWSALAYMVCQQEEKKTDNIRDFQRLTSSFNVPFKINKVDLNFQVQPADAFTQELVKWIDRTYAADWPPYLCLLQITKFNITLRIEMDSVLLTWRNEILNFEENSGHIKMINNTPIVAEKFSNDLLTSVNFAHFGYKKLFLNKFLDKNKKEQSDS
ncbi:ATV_HP_G0096050.mRNA.1.CDS.1 [Saccharomyces cerevisiae]|nr:ATV_HP_G0096050.mRNA.1.CDS.1 [Saccharomyces cerevisiae]CAI6539732.1 ATV_HP_G0096050.mRNA.1.CDS.1 [Saccharomyces cerevisiae]CAI7368547.1 CIH_collapsed_G0030780.mRNA.1.CDS.1 [Saccharomyces cerevisiae]